MEVVQNIHILELGIGFLAINNKIIIEYGKFAYPNTSFTLPKAFTKYYSVVLTAFNGIESMNIICTSKSLTKVNVDWWSSGGQVVSAFFVCIGY